MQSHRPPSLSPSSPGRRTAWGCNFHALFCEFPSAPCHIMAVLIDCPLMLCQFLAVNGTPATHAGAGSQVSRAQNPCAGRDSRLAITCAKHVDAITKDVCVIAKDVRTITKHV